MNALTLSKQDHHLLTSLYQDLDTMDISRQAREGLNQAEWNPATAAAVDDSSFTYGEIVFDEFTDMLNVVKPKQDEVFYDLGSGAGKAVLCAALLNTWKKCCGVDLLLGLHSCANQVLTQLKEACRTSPEYEERIRTIQFLQADFLQVDLSDADVIFSHATCFGPALWEPLAEKFKQLKTGTRFILVTKRLHDDCFELLRETNQPFSWGAATVSIYKKV